MLAVILHSLPSLNEICFPSPILLRICSGKRQDHWQSLPLWEGTGCECAVKGPWEHNRWIAEERRCVNSYGLLAFIKTFHKIYWVYKCVMHQKKWTLPLFFLFIEAITPCQSDLHVEFKKWWDTLTPKPCLFSIWMLNWLFEVTIRRTTDKGGNWRRQLTPVNQNLNSFLLHN